MPDDSKKKTKKFEDITKVADLIAYLDSFGPRLSITENLYHYTTLENAVKIIQGQKWHLVSAKDMNDRREYRNGDDKRWDNLFFASFMREDKESIGMWSMYSQPWRKGVKISIPKETFKQWVGEISVIHEISKINYQPTGRSIKLYKNSDARVYISTVAYSNSESLEDRKKSKEMLQCGGEKNVHIHNAVSIPELTGYVKDMAWVAEKEVRIKAEFDNSEYKFERVAIDVPDYVIENMTITASPLFKGDLHEELENTIKRLSIKTDKSLFNGDLEVKHPCSECML